MTFKKWVKIFPFFIVERLATWALPCYKFQAKEVVYGYEVDDGTWIFFSEHKGKEMLKKKEDKRRKKAEKAYKKLKDILRNHPELKQRLLNELGVEKEVEP